MNEIDNVEKAKNLFTWFKGLDQGWQVFIFSLIVGGTGWSAIQALMNKTISDLKIENSRLIKDNANDKIVSETRFANSERKCDELVGYWKKRSENLELENKTMVRDAIADSKREMQELKNQYHIQDEQKLRTNEKR